MAAPTEITCKNLLRLIGLPDCPVIVDISIDPDFADDPYLIPRSFRHPHSDLDGLIALLYGRACIITCQRGIKLSQGLTSRLRGRGIDAQYLSGGMYGWRDTDHAPRIPFVAPEWVAGVADRYNGAPFDAVLDAFDLRAADTGTHDTPQAAGLLALSVGLSRMHRDDHGQLDAAMPMYDALYRWARDGVDETHASFGGVS